MQKTEIQWLKHISHTVLQIEPVLIKFDNDFREVEGSSRKEQLLSYSPFKEITHDGLDGLIITGDNIEMRPDSQELMKFEEIYYYKELRDIIRWARKNVYSTIYSCLASHFALYILYGLERKLSPNKIFGVFKHKISQENTNPMIENMDDFINAPHSRWGNISTNLLNVTGVIPLAIHDEAGWLLASDRNAIGGFDYFLQGHPEYERFDLNEEFIRDRSQGQEQPVNYYKNNNPKNRPVLSWANDVRALHSNWINMIYRNFSE